jgi:hypothetical protein
VTDVWLVIRSINPSGTSNANIDLNGSSFHRCKGGFKISGSNIEPGGGKIEPDSGKFTLDKGSSVLSNVCWVFNTLSLPALPHAEQALRRQK